MTIVTEAFDLMTLPMYHPQFDQNPLSHNVVRFKSAVKAADAVLISTPEYLGNIPAVLKNAMEWLKSGGELTSKKVLPITFTPYAPRGEKAMQSLCWTLASLDANIVTQLSLYHSDFHNKNGQVVFKGTGEDLLTEAIQLLQ
jgi:NAD(P)H-dependent FMN reductase